jgi:hypothetical protein
MKKHGISRSQNRICLNVEVESRHAESMCKPQSYGRRNYEEGIELVTRVRAAI